MANTPNQLMPIETDISTKIFTLRGEQVMIDRDLAELYGVETRVLNQAVKRNMERFPEHFMFQITVSELDKWKSQIVISNKETNVANLLTERYNNETK